MTKIFVGPNQFTFQLDKIEYETDAIVFHILISPAESASLFPKIELKLPKFPMEIYDFINRLGFNKARDMILDLNNGEITLKDGTVLKLPKSEPSKK